MHALLSGVNEVLTGIRKRFTGKASGHESLRLSSPKNLTVFSVSDGHPNVKKDLATASLRVIMAISFL